MTKSPAAPTAEADAPPRLSALLARLEAIRRDLDREDLDLEDQLDLYREGVRLAAQARQIVDGATSEVEILMGEGEE